MEVEQTLLGMAWLSVGELSELIVKGRRWSQSAVKLRELVGAGEPLGIVAPLHRMPYPGKDKLLVGDYNASFVGFAPADNPVLSMIVVVERPETTIFGGAVAAPIFQEVMSYALHHYNIPSNGTNQQPLHGAGASISSDVT